MNRRMIFSLAGLALALALATTAATNTNDMTTVTLSKRPPRLAQNGKTDTNTANWINGHTNVQQKTVKASYDIITNTDAIRRCTGCDSTWIPTNQDIEPINKALKAYLDKVLVAATNEFGDDVREDFTYIRRNLRKYRRQYAGVVRDGRKLIFCSMSASYIYDKNTSAVNENDFIFEHICDGGTDIVRFYYDVEKQEVTSVDWNGEA